MKKAIIAIGAVVVAAALILPTTSFANPLVENGDGSVSTTVVYTDLDLAAESGVNALRHRIDTAAKDVCGRPYAFEIFLTAGRVACINYAVASAQPAFDSVVGAYRHGSVTVGDSAALIVTAPAQ